MHMGTGTLALRSGRVVEVTYQFGTAVDDIRRHPYLRRLTARSSRVLFSHEVKLPRRLDSRTGYRAWDRPQPLRHRARDQREFERTLNGSSGDGRIPLHREVL
jgi:hypothetical protein